MNVCFITTTDHNVGDDFVRYGVQYLLKQAIGNIDSSLVHKHIPLTVRPEWQWFYQKGFSKFIDNLPRFKGLFWSNIIDKLPLNHNTDKILICDLLVQSGAPVFWPNCQSNEWYKPLIKKRYLSLPVKPPFINIGAGACLGYRSGTGELLDSVETVAYIRELVSNCQITTLRDTLSREILNRIGLDAPVIACPSIFARDKLGIEPHSPEYIVLNYMALGGHFKFDQEIDTEGWEAAFKNFYQTVRERYPIVVACHDQAEYESAQRVCPGARLFLGKTAQDFLECYAKAKFFIGCRVHAAFAIASFGRPGFVIGTDTRALMTREIGLESAFVNDVTVEKLIEQYNYLESSADVYACHFAQIRQKAFNDYQSALEPLEALSADIKC